METSNSRVVQVIGRSSHIPLGGRSPQSTTPREYRVSQLNLAAFLVVAGHALLRLEPAHSGERFCEFIFDRNERIAQDRLRYYEYQTKVDARLFAETLLDLKRRAVKTLEDQSVNDHRDQ